MANAVADAWQPVSPEDLQLKREPKAPTAPAIYLYRQVDRDDENNGESVYYRIKILTEEGRERANVEIAYAKGRESIRNLQARTIQPDGSIVEFDGTVYEKPLVKARGFSMMSKSFTLPGVVVGSIIEYRYRRTLPAGWVFDSRWLISDELFTRHAVFSLRPSPFYSLRWSWPLGLPPDTREPAKDRGLIRLETHDVPAFVSEEYMPPEDVMKYRVEFIYEEAGSSQKEEVAYWKAVGKRLRGKIARFVASDRPLEQEVARLIQPGDSAEAKTRKLYARSQQIRNVAFERQRTEDEIKRDKRPENDNAADVLEIGFASPDEITWTLYGLLRAAKIDASIVYVAPRDDYFFSAQLMNSSQLITCVVLVNIDNNEIFLDPGTPFTPFAMLPWSETAITGLRLGEKTESWVNTILPKASDSRVERKAVLKLDDGTLTGKVTVTYVGLEAAWRRVAERNEDATERRKFLEQDLESDVPTGIEVELTNTPEWTDPEKPLIAQFDITVPGWARHAGNRVLVPVGLFSSAEKHKFEHAARVHPVYFRFPYQHTDEVTIELPPGWLATSLPQPRANDAKFATYGSTAQFSGGMLSMKREVALNSILVKRQFYDVIRGFYQTVRAGDEEQVVVTPAAPAATRKH
jgi:hypothetical protein